MPEMSKAEKIQEYKDLYHHYDTKKNGKVSVSKLGEMIMSCGLAPTTQELKKLDKKVRSSGTKFLTLAKFLSIVQGSTFTQQGDAKANVMNAFSFYGSCRSSTPGYISKEDMQYAMTHFGGKLSKVEVKKMFEAIDKCRAVKRTDAGEINIRDFVEHILCL